MSTVGPTLEPSSVAATLFVRFQESVSQAVERNFGNQGAVGGKAGSAGGHPKMLKRSTLSRNEIVTDTSERMWHNFPRKASFYEPSIISFAKLANSSLETVVQLFLYWLPLHSTAYAQMHDLKERIPYPIVEIYGYDHFIAKLKNFEAYDQRQYDLAECVVDLIVADALAACLQFFKGDNLSASVVSKLTDLCFYFFKPRDPKWSQHASLWYTMRGAITQQWTSILAILTRCSCPHIDRTELLKTALAPANNDDQAALLKGLRWLMFDTSSKSGIAQSESFLDQLLAAIDDKKKSNKPLMLEVLDAVLESVDFSEGVLEGISSKAKDIFKRAAKWLKIDELEFPANRLMGTILSRGSTSMFESEIDAFITKKVLKGVWSSNPRKRDANLETLLRVLRGKHMSERISWLPQAPGLFPATPLPYSYVPFAYTPAKMADRLKNIVLGLFSKKTPLIKSTEGLDVCVDIVVQIAAHSMTLTREFLLPMLLSERNSIMVHQLIGLRAIRVIFDISSGFWTEVPWNTTNPKLAQAGYARLDHVVPREELEKIFETTLMKLLVAAEGSAGFSTCGSNGNALRVTTSMKPSEIVIREHEINEDSTMARILSETTKESITRWYEIVTKSPEKREKDLTEKLKNADKRLMETVRIWCSHSLVPTRGLVDASVDSRDELKKKRAAAAVAGEKNISLELYKEDVRCIPLILPDDIVRIFSASSFFGQLLVHNDNELATICSHSLQRIMVEHPKHRTPIMKGMIALIQNYTYDESLGLQVVLGQLSALLDLWNYLKYDTPMAKADPYNDPDQPFVDEAYAVAMVHLCHPDSEIRYLSFQIVRALSSLKPSAQGNFATIMELNNSSIIEQARYRFLLNGGHGLDSIKVQDGQTSKSITIQEAAITQQLAFWSYVLSEIGKCLVDSGAPLATLRENLLARLTGLSVPPLDPSGEASFSYDYRVVRRNYASLLFAISAPASNEFQNRDFLQWQAKFIEAFTSSKQTGLLNGLLSDVEWVRDLIVIACGGTHWHGFDVVINGLNNWYSNQKKKDKPKVKPMVASILRQISQERDFSKALHKFVGICAVYLQFINEMESVFSTLPRVNNEYYFIDSILTVKHFCEAIFQPKYCPTRGPVRLHLTKSNPPGLEWSDADRYKLFKLMLQWFSDIQKDDINQEITKNLAKIKEQAKRDEKKKEYDRAIRDIMTCIRFSVENLSEVGPIFPEEHRGTIKDHLDFIVAAELKGHTINRWILSFHFAEALPVFVDNSYARSAEESVLFIQPVFDQYLALQDQRAPSTGITSQLKEYYSNIGLEHKEAKRLENAPLKKEDEVFAQLTLQNAGVLLHLALFNAIHPDSIVRSRAVDLLVRLIPNRFGEAQQIPEIQSTSELRARLEIFKGLAAQVLPKARPNALELSEITAKAVPSLTEVLFKEACIRLIGKSMHLGGKKWIIDLLLPWCDNVELGPKSTFKTYTADTFLEDIYTNFVLDMVPDDIDIPSGLVLLWQSLAEVSTDNLAIIINFLLRKATSAAKHLNICKSIILYIYRKNAPPTLSPLLTHFNISTAKEEEDEAGKKLRENFQLREAAIAILHDLITDNVQPLIPHLHVLLSYTLLKGNSTESKGLSKLLIAITNAVHNLLLARRDQDALLNSLRTLNSCMDLPGFRIKWNYTKYSKESTWSSKDIDTTLSGVADTGDLADISQWFGQPIDANKVIIIFCDCLHQIAPELLERWANSSLNYAVNHPDPQLAIMAHQMYRAIGSTVDQECVNQLLTSLLDSMERIESILEKTISLAKDPKRTTSKRFATNETMITIYRGKAMEVLLTLQTIAPAVLEVTTLRLIFWTAVTFLRSPLPPFTQLYHQALQLMTVLLERDFVAATDPATFENTQQVLSKAQGYPFKGIQPWLFQGLGSRATEKFAAPLIASLMKIPHDNIVHSSPIRYPLTVLGLLPWIHSGVSSTIASDPLYFDTCLTLAENLGPRLPTTVQTLKSLLDGAFVTQPDKLLGPICDELHATCLPNFSDWFAEVLSSLVKTNSKFLNSVLLITYIFLTKENAIDYVTSFQDLIKAATEKASTLRCASDVLMVSTKLLLQKYPGSALHAKIKPLGVLHQVPINIKFSSIVIRQLMATSGSCLLPPPVAGPAKRLVTPRGAKPSATFTKGHQTTPSVSNPVVVPSKSGDELQVPTGAASAPALPSPKVYSKPTPRVVAHQYTTPVDKEDSSEKTGGSLYTEEDSEEEEDYEYEYDAMDSARGDKPYTPRAEDDLRNLAADLDIPTDFSGGSSGDFSFDVGSTNLDVNVNELDSALSVLEKYM